MRFTTDGSQNKILNVVQQRKNPRRDPNWTRTNDPHIKTVVLYQLSYEVEQIWRLLTFQSVRSPPFLIICRCAWVGCQLSCGREIINPWGAAAYIYHLFLVRVGLLPLLLYMQTWLVPWCCVTILGLVLISIL